MRLKLSGPDYKGTSLQISNTDIVKDMDPVLALEDFRKRVANYEKSYEPIAEYEEEIENIQYCKVASYLSCLLSYIR